MDAGAKKSRWVDFTARADWTGWVDLNTGAEKSRRIDLAARADKFRWAARSSEPRSQDVSNWLPETSLDGLTRPSERKV